MKVQNWEDIFSLVAAFAFRGHISYLVGGGTYKTTLPATDSVSCGILQFPEFSERVLVSPKAFCNHSKAEGKSRWIAFTSALRHLKVGGVALLQPNVAATCSSHVIAWPPCFDQFFA